MSVANKAIPSLSGVYKAPLLIGSILIAGGLFLLIWLGWSLLHSTSGEGAPYQYQKVAEGKIEDFSDLEDLKNYKNLGISILKYELIAEKVQKTPLAEFYTGTRDKKDSPVLLLWKNNLREPIITITSGAKDLNDLAQAVIQHVPKTGMVLSWWDTSHRLNLLTGANTLFHENMDEPIIIPSPWANQSEGIRKFENEFWQVSDSNKERKQLGDLVDAFLADETTGVSMLRSFTKNKDVYIVVHYSDIYKMGIMEPNRLGIGFKDFPNQGQTHALIPHVKEWVEKNGYTSYLVERLDKDVIRAYFLTDNSSKDTLIAKMLPFNSSNPAKLKELRLLAQYGGYWVYSLPMDSNK
ncbi:hydroxylamine oxidation protein HaoB [Candidatus Nitrosacidococcus sp. I8]|uniref:hydroxylamine oxidation protein HaoB n=1 Tax=Candidatus Nitrosacidococcus sp. I8 TaxID=2942908 RepID=UPI0022266ECD|nr:hydroxylamine oxidation protein HaoB [Candidatus Nitrosacidococcus sp. I8]CAH9018839.1 hypothetical protein NURINAE_01168 [Candidatus Nitrosacidococcus sp. I8]